MKAKRGRPPKKIIKNNPSYSRLSIRKVLQDYLLQDPYDILHTQNANKAINEVLELLDHE
jgi:hypothetical protein